jgi:hypothetical protein
MGLCGVGFMICVLEIIFDRMEPFGKIVNIATLERLCKLKRNHSSRFEAYCRSKSSRRAQMCFQGLISRQLPHRCSSGPRRSAVEHWWLADVVHCNGRCQISRPRGCLARETETDRIQSAVLGNDTVPSPCA